MIQSPGDPWAFLRDDVEGRELERLALIDQVTLLGGRVDALEAENARLRARNAYLESVIAD